MERSASKDVCKKDIHCSAVTPQLTIPDQHKWLLNPKQINNNQFWSLSQFKDATGLCAKQARNKIPLGTGRFFIFSSQKEENR